jgi:hypothetical protein
LLAERGFESQKRAQAEEKRRQERQNQRRELQPYKVATAQCQFERLAERLIKEKAAAQAPHSGLVAA